MNWKRSGKYALLGVAAVVGAVVIVRNDGVHFSELSPKLRRKLRSAGRRGEWRNQTEAEEFYLSHVPWMVRSQGEDAIWRFLDNKDASHQKSVHNDPESADSDANIHFEQRNRNRRRYTNDMTVKDHARTLFDNHIEGVKILASRKINATAQKATDVVRKAASR